MPDSDEVGGTADVGREQPAEMALVQPGLVADVRAVGAAEAEPVGSHKRAPGVAGQRVEERGQLRRRRDRRERRQQHDGRAGGVGAGAHDKPHRPLVEHERLFFARQWQRQRLRRRYGTALGHASSGHRAHGHRAAGKGACLLRRLAGGAAQQGDETV